MVANSPYSEAIRDWCVARQAGNRERADAAGARLDAIVASDRPVKAWLRRLLPKRPMHVFGPEHIVRIVVDDVPVSERRFRLCLICGRSSAMAEAGFKCRRIPWLRS